MHIIMLIHGTYVLYYYTLRIRFNIIVVVVVVLIIIIISFATDTICTHKRIHNSYRQVYTGARCASHIL